MKKKTLFLLALSLMFFAQGRTQSIRRIRDPHIRAQQQRMVFTQWGDFLPRPRNFLGINVNPHYTLTWSWGAPTQNRRYRSGADIRPLGPAGEQTQRMALNTVLQATSNSYAQHSDSLARTAVSELYHHSGLFSGIDPLWQLYYRKELRDVTDYSLASATTGLSDSERAYLAETGVIEWFDGEMQRLQERLGGAFNSDMDRGGRVLAYHRILKEYRKLLGTWDTHIHLASTLLALRETALKSKGSSPMEFSQWDIRDDAQLMRRIIDEAKKLY